MRKKTLKQEVLAREYSREIIMHAEEHGQRTGQYLFNSLAPDISTRVTGMLWDPFHKDLSQFQVEEWLMNHIIFDDNGAMIVLFNKNDVLWERKY